MIRLTAAMTLFAGALAVPDVHRQLDEYDPHPMRRSTAIGGTCVNDDSTTSSDGTSTCTTWFDHHTTDCGQYGVQADEGGRVHAPFDSYVQCCMCGGGNVATPASAAATAAAKAGTAAWAVPSTDSAFMAEVSAALLPDANGDHHLWFYSIDTSTTFPRCGEVDAAPFMPSALFEPENLLELAAYAEATVRLYRTPVLNTATELGRCASIGYTDHGGTVDGIGWTPGDLMGPVCSDRCGCNFQASNFPAGSASLPACQDVPDDPSKGAFCSLCGPSTSCDGCRGGTVTIELYYPPEGQDRGPRCEGNYVDGVATGVTRPLGTPCPRGTTSNCRNAAGTEVSCGPPKRGERGGLPNRAPTPTPTPSADAQLWFRLVTGPTLNFRAPLHCGEVDAAQRMPAALFDEEHAAALARYKRVSLAWLPGLELGRCADVGYGVPAGSASATWDPSTIMSGICMAQCDCEYRGGLGGRQGPCNNIPDDPNSGTFCSLCGDNDFNSRATIAIYNQGAPQADNHLFFYFINEGANQCGDIDAASFMPASLFEPANTLELAAYVEATTQLFAVQSGGGLDRTPRVTVRPSLGRCADNGYGRQRPATANVQWTPTELMAPACNLNCNCRWNAQRAGACHGRALNDPAQARLCSLPVCTDGNINHVDFPQTDDPSNGHFCSLCSGFYPDTVAVTLFNRDSGH